MERSKFGLAGIAGLLSIALIASPALAVVDDSGPSVEPDIEVENVDEVLIEEPVSREFLEEETSDPGPGLAVAAVTPMSSVAPGQVALDIINAERGKAGLEPLLNTQDMYNISMAWSSYMAGVDKMIHIYQVKSTAYQQQFAKNMGFYIGGDLIAWNYQSEAAVAKAWLNSPGHRAWLMDAYGPMKAAGVARVGNYWTLYIAGRPLTKPAPDYTPTSPNSVVLAPSTNIPNPDDYGPGKSPLSSSSPAEATGVEISGIFEVPNTITAKGTYKGSPASGVTETYTWSSTAGNKTGPSLKLTEDYYGTYVTVTYKVVDKATNKSSVATSVVYIAAKPVVDVKPPAVATSVSITGKTAIGSTLTAKGVRTGDSGKGFTESYQWVVDGATVSSKNTYKIVEKDAEKVVRVNYSVKDTGTGEVTTATAFVTADKKPVETYNPNISTTVSISGSNVVGSTIAAAGSYTGSPISGVTESYLWSVGGIVIGSGKSFLIFPEDAGKQVTVKYTVKDLKDNREYTSYASVTPVKAPEVEVYEPGITVSATYSGEGKVGSTVKINGNWSGKPKEGVTQSYKWTSNGSVLAETASYTIKNNDAGKNLQGVYSIKDNYDGRVYTRNVTVPVASVVVDPAVASSVSITGVAKNGNILTAKGTYSGSGVNVSESYTWYVDNSVVGVASSYKVTEGDAGRTIKVVYTVNDSGVATTKETSVKVAALSPDWTPPKTFAEGFIGHDIAYSGDFDSNGKPDLISVDPRGNMYLYCGCSDTGLVRTKMMGRNWGVMDQLQPTINWAGDGTPGLLARNSITGDMFYYSSNGYGGILGTTKIGTGFGQFDSLTAFQTDEGPKLLAVSKTGLARVYAGNGQGGFASSASHKTIGTGWGKYNYILNGGNQGGSTGYDLLLREGSQLERQSVMADGALAESFKIGEGFQYDSLGISDTTFGKEYPSIWAQKDNGQIDELKFNGLK